MATLPRRGIQHARQAVVDEIASKVNAGGAEASDRLFGIEAAAGRIERLLYETGARFDALETRIGELVAEIQDLRRSLDLVVDVGNESTELLGRLLRAATARLEDLEEQVRQEK